MRWEKEAVENKPGGGGGEEEGRTKDGGLGLGMKEQTDPEEESR